MQLLINALDMLDTDPIFLHSGLSKMIELQCNNDKAVKQFIENQKEVRSIFKRLSSGHQVIMISLIQLS